MWARQQQLRSFDDAIIASPAGLERPKQVVGLPDAVDTHGDGETVVFEERRIVGRQQRRIGGQRKRDLDPADAAFSAA